LRWTCAFCPSDRPSHSLLLMRSLSTARLASFSLRFSSCSASFSWRGVRLRFLALAC
jgi:hypothetical protein